MTLLQILILAVIQGICELLPVSSSAHVILAERMMGIDPTSPEMTLLLVMLHTGTMLAVIAYFWRSWHARYFRTLPSFATFAKEVVIATALTGIVGLLLLLLIEKVVLAGSLHAEVEQIFGNPYIIASGLTATGVMIILSSKRTPMANPPAVVALRGALWIGAVQGLCLPFRGFSRSGSTTQVRPPYERSACRGCPIARPAAQYRLLACALTKSRHPNNSTERHLPGA